MSQDFTHSQTFAAPPAQLYRAFTNSTFLREWLSDVATTAPRPGGYLFLAWNDGYYASGQFTSLAENEQVAFSWQGSNMPAPTQVNVRLNPAGEGTLLHLTHSALGEGDAWAGIAAQVQKGWQQSLENLASVLTTGEDLRFTRRPMLGIIIGEFNPETAARLGVPVSEGTRLDSVVEGMGAAAAGLQSDDVIVAVDGLPTTDFPSLTNALQAHRAGDTVEVAFYRGPDRLTTAMTLSGRPLPAIPATAGELASIAHHRYDAEEADLATLLADVSETEASTRPGPGQWHIKDVLAHLIHSERGWHTWMDGLIGGQEPWYDDFGGNNDARITATVAAYPTLADLLTELQRAHTESVALLANLPAGFMDHKGSYWRLAYAVLEPAYHQQTHLAQMQEILAAARQ